MQSSIHNRSNNERSLFGSALLLTLIVFSSSSYAEKEVKSDDAIIATATDTTNPNGSLKQSNKQTLNLSSQKLSKLMLLKQSNTRFPDNPEIAARLATAYVQLAREKSEDNYYRLAKQVIKPWAKKAIIPGVTSKATPLEIRLIRATLAQHDHHYADASDDLLALIKKQPRNAQAWLTLSTIQLVQGDYKKAQVSCSALSRVTSSWFATLCYSQLYSLTGSAQRAYKMQKGLLLKLAPQQVALRLWVTGLMAETALRIGNKTQAEQHFKEGIGIKPTDTYILRTYSDFLLSEQRYKEVKSLLKAFSHNDQLLLRFAIASKYSKDKVQLASLINTLEKRFADTMARNNHTHGRDESLFLIEFKANDAESRAYALTLAETNWKTQKEPDDALILLRATHANKQPEKANKVLDWIRENKLQDPRMSQFI